VSIAQALQIADSINPKSFELNAKQYSKWQLALAARVLAGAYRRARQITKMVHKCEACFGCVHLTRTWHGDGSVTYGCRLRPSLITGEDSILDEDIPKACAEYTPARKGDAE